MNARFLLGKGKSTAKTLMTFRSVFFRNTITQSLPKRSASTLTGDLPGRATGKMQPHILEVQNKWLYPLCWSAEE